MRPRWAMAAVAVVVAVVLAAALVGAVSPSGPEEVVVTIRHSRFEPSHLEVRAGTTVRFVVRNTDPIPHELIVGDASVQRRHERGTEPEHGDVAGEVSIPVGAVRSTTYRFDRPGEVLFGCHLPGHYAYGMRGTISVVP